MRTQPTHKPQEEIRGHTPTPKWEKIPTLKDYAVIRGMTANDLIIEIDGIEYEFSKAFVARAVNAYQPMVDALRRARGILMESADFERLDKETVGAVDEIEQALSRAGGER